MAPMKTTPVLSATRSGLTLLPALAAGFALVTAHVASAKPGNGKGKGQSGDFVPPGHGGTPPGLADKVPPGHRRAPVEFVVIKAPPPLRVEVTPPRPSVKHVWVPGYWVWETNAYVWAPGVWMPPPEPAAVWVAPRFETRSGVSVFISGYWRL